MQARIRKAMEEKDQGFTLIELLVVIIIIGILSAIAIPVFLNQRKKGVDASLKADLKSMATLQETYITDNPSQPGKNITETAVAVNVADADTTVLDFRPSPDNKVSVATKVTAGNNVGYCIKATNAGSSGGSGKYLYYDSAAGGLQKNFNPTTGLVAC